MVRAGALFKAVSRSSPGTATSSRRRVRGGNHAVGLDAGQVKLVQFVNMSQDIVQLPAQEGDFIIR